MNLANCLENTADRLPDKIGLWFEGTSYTYNELNRLSNRIANGLSAIGLKRGERCVLMMQSSPEFIATYYALAKIGAVIIPVNFLSKSHELSYILSDSGATCFIGMEPFLDEPRNVLKHLPDVRIRIAAGIQEDADFIPLSKIDGSDKFSSYPSKDEDVLAIIYTSGTTGLPKGVMLTHGNIFSNAKIAERRQDESDTIIISALPLYHAFGLTAVLNASIYLGLTLHLFREFDSKNMIEVIEKAAKSVLIAVPTMFRRLIVEADQCGIKRSSLRYCLSGGASLPVETLTKFERRFKTKIYEGYGLTECSPSCIRNPIGGKRKPGSVGLPLHGFCVRIIDESGRDVKKGEVGELIVKGPGVMKGYLNRPEETARTVVNGWLYTGDLARMDEEGYIYIVDRKKDVIIRGGYNIYPKEIEEVLALHPCVADAAVFGVPHDDLGEEIAAAVVLKKGASATEEDLRQFTRDRVAPYKYPRFIQLVNQLPKGPTGKVLKRTLRSNFAHKIQEREGHKMKKLFFSIVFMVMALTLVLAPGGVAKTFDLKFQLAFPKKFPAGKNFQFFAKRVETLTDGNVKIRLFEPGQLVKAKGVFNALRKGVIDLYGGSMLYFAGNVPEVNCEWLPFTWATSEEVVEIYHDHGWLTLLNEAVMKHGIRYVTPIPMASMGLITKFPIYRLEDLKGKKIRAVGMEGMIVKALGGSAVSLPAPEQYLALQRGVVDGTDFAFFTIAQWKFYEVCKYVSLPALHSPAVINLLINENVYKSLPEQYQKAIDKAGHEVLLKAAEQHRKLDEYAYRVCKEHDVTVITLDPKEAKRFRKATLVLWSEMAQKTEISRKLIENLRAFLKAKGRSEQ